MTTHIHQGNTQSQRVDASLSAASEHAPSSAENLDYQQTHDETPILKVRNLTKRYPVKTSVFSRKKVMFTRLSMCRLTFIKARHLQL